MSNKIEIPIRSVADMVIRGFAADEAFRKKWSSDTGRTYPADRSELNAIAIELGIDDDHLFNASGPRMLEVVRVKLKHQADTQVDTRVKERKSSGLTLDQVREMVLAYLLNHHQFDGDSIGNFDPVKVKDVAMTMKVKGPRISEAFSNGKLFGRDDKQTGYARYKILCRKGLLSKLQSLAGESPQATGKGDAIGSISGSIGDEDLQDEIFDRGEKFGYPGS